MPYVVTDACTKDFICVATCPNNAIHPAEDEAAAETVPQVYINPDECIDCGACSPECSSSSIFALDELPEDKAEFAAKNAAYFN
jgi:NAD-dependent dihydropyrimidine dehydrogenase PreA subunit